LVVATLLVWACATSKPPPTCDPGKSLCDGTCIDPQNDPDNCGKCGSACPLAQVCSSGKCAQECPSGNSVCTPDGGTRGYCIDTKSDNGNCGKCGAACASGQTCVNGSCSSACATGSTLCSPDSGTPYCANLKNDQGNCGQCGKACLSDQLCSSGNCVGSCTSTQKQCTPDAGAPYCADTDTDNANCGACGTLCGLLQACVGGQCTSQCTGQQTLCKPDGGQPFCADTLTDNTNCGTCGNKCPSNKPVCSGGTCSTGACNLNALVLGDGVAASNSAYQTLLQGVGFTVNLQSSGTTTYTGSPAATGFGVIIVTPGTTYTTDMPSGGQSAIVNAVGASAQTGVIFTEWAAYMVSIGDYTTLSPLILFTRSSGYTGALTFTLTQSGHPIWNGLPSSFTTASLGSNISGTLASGAIQIASCTQCGQYGVAAKDTGTTGRIVQIAHAAAYSGSWYTDTNLTKMMANAALWAARCD